MFSLQLREASLLASKFFKDIAEIFDDQGPAGGKCYHFPWEKFAEEKMAGGKNFFGELHSSYF